jgi:hypothetical protein
LSFDLSDKTIFARGRQSIAGEPTDTEMSGFWFGGLDMHHFKARILALALIVVSVGLIYYNWHQLHQEGRYSMKLAAFGPVVGIGGVFLLLFPSMGGKPTTAKEKIVVLVVFVIGLVAGLINWYLMDPGFFGR